MGDDRGLIQASPGKVRRNSAPGLRLTRSTVTAHGLRQSLHQGQTDPGPQRFPGQGPLAAIEEAEDLLHLPPRDPGP